MWHLLLDLDPYGGPDPLSMFPLFLMRTAQVVIIIIIIITRGRQFKAKRERYTPYQSEDPSLTIPSYRLDEEKGKNSTRL